MFPPPLKFEPPYYEDDAGCTVADIQVIGIDKDGFLTDDMSPPDGNGIWFMVKLQFSGVNAALDSLYIATDGDVWYALEQDISDKSKMRDPKISVNRGKIKICRQSDIQAAIKKLISEIEGNDN